MGASNIGGLSMNAVHMHLILNHIPVMGTLFGIIFLLLALAGRNKAIIKASLWILVFVAILTIPAYFTGGSAEEMVENLPGISEDIIHEHEESAEKAFIAALILGLLAAVRLLRYRTRSRVSGMFLATLTLFAIITGVLMASAANEGGNIRHPEIQSGWTAPGNTDHDTLPDTEFEDES